MTKTLLRFREFYIPYFALDLSTRREACALDIELSTAPYISCKLYKKSIQFWISQSVTQMSKISWCGIGWSMSYVERKHLIRWNSWNGLKDFYRGHSQLTSCSSTKASDFSSFHSVSVEEVSKLLNQSPVTTCDLASILASLVKQCGSVLVPTISPK